MRAVKLVAAASTEFERAVRELPPQVWSHPTPSALTIRELVTHVVAGNRLTALLLAGHSRAEALAQIEGDLLGDDPLVAVLTSAREQTAAFATASPDQPLPGPAGEATASDYLRFRLVDLVVHAWDLRRGAGLDEALDPDLVVATARLVEPHLPAMLALGVYGDGPSGSLPPEASEQVRLLDAFGRRP
ncbi:TIGR03086 family metal-binding protein [Ruania halotolerans]|uniref:TIGR03086 family metal-binding protein n=1 Tax=Ruania halotolerans TaxID=2897773 RepID=UPI001E57D56C|nr:TIGR03086 family metal-binding protein [Ruania halotolerans]UFU05892.1 TIGR03086 family metal-binding protein [Ruania halotolerans]